MSKHKVVPIRKDDRLLRITLLTNKINALLAELKEVSDDLRRDAEKGTRCSKDGTQ